MKREDFESFHLEAIKRKLVEELEHEMKRQKITQLEFGKRMNKKRASVLRILDPKKVRVSLKSLGQAALALGKDLRVSIR